MGQALQLTDETFDQEITQAKGVALVDFWAPWCGPCVRIAPIIEEIAGEFQGKVKVAKMDTDQSPKTATRFSIMSIPSLLIFKDGKVYDKIMGAVPKAQIAERLNRALSAS